MLTYYTKLANWPQRIVFKKTYLGPAAFALCHIARKNALSPGLGYPIMIAASAAQKNPAEIPQMALPKSMNQVLAETLFVYNPAPYRGYPIAPRASPYLSPMRLLMAPAATQTTEKSPYTNALAADTAYGSAAPPAPSPPSASHIPGAVKETAHATMI
jgi:hypothetical protein